VTLKYDDQVVVLMQSMAGAMHTPAPRGDWKTLRSNTAAMFDMFNANMTAPAGVTWTDYSTVSSDGGAIRLCWIVPAERVAGPALVYIHGGGMIMCSVDDYLLGLAEQVAETGVPFLAVDFRNAPESPAAQLAEDALAGVVWLHEHADELDVDRARIAIGGDSGGGGIAAGATILARDRGVPVSKQILTCAMLDDRTMEPDPELLPFITWNYDDNYTAWRTVLGHEPGTRGVPPTIAPARLTDFRGLPPAYIDTGELDIFRDEDIRYAMGLLQAGVHVDFHLTPGVPHGFEGNARSRRADAIRSI
jgi:acetyl esterase/lipase